MRPATSLALDAVDLVELIGLVSFAARERPNERGQRRAIVSSVRDVSSNALFSTNEQFEALRMACQAYSPGAGTLPDCIVPI